MKRLVWLVLALCCTAFWQLQAVDALGAKAKPCSCCCSGACGRPGCCPLPASASPVLETSPVAEVARQPSARATRLTLEWARSFCFSVGAPTELVGPRTASALALAPPANVPLYAAHCSLLI